MAKKRKKYVMTAAHKAKLKAAAAKRRGVKRGPYKVEKKVSVKGGATFATNVQREIERLEDQIKLLKKLL